MDEDHGGWEEFLAERAAWSDDGWSSDDAVGGMALEAPEAEEAGAEDEEMEGMEDAEIGGLEEESGMDPEEEGAAAKPAPPKPGPSSGSFFSLTLVMR